ncbi:glycosyltransferase family 4 protein [Halococcus sp. AFM35]|uniref:glycosyltransferase family 4 protein n=1 Tax=Halococcus sp. AFM35 TaxID=3421653 RepID=UPI003EBFF81D
MTESYLAISDFSGGVSETGRMAEHLGPLGEHVETTVVCLVADDGVDALTYREAPTTGLRALDLLSLFAVALTEGARNDYDGVVSISLVPYGCFALAVGWLCGLPTHLAIIGVDLDVHARARYDALTAALFRQFDAITVPGTAHRDQLEALGVPGERIEILANGVDRGTYSPAETSVDYDYIWVGRFSAEKDPLLFVRTMAALVERGEQPRAAMLGTGPLDGAVDDRIDELGLDDYIDRPGWVDEPANYYHRARTFVLTSERDALPLTLLEAMACGLVPVVPDVGNVRDAVTDGESGIVLDGRDAASFASALQRLDDDELYHRLSAAAPAVCARFSTERAVEDWQSVLGTLRAVNGRDAET